jgi:hypothetical protein
MKFHDYTLDAHARIMSQRVHDTEKLERKAIDVFIDLIGMRTHYEGPVHEQWPHIKLKWTDAGQQAMATFFSREDLLTQNALQATKESTVIDMLIQTLSEARQMRFPRVVIPERPALVTLVWPSPAIDDLQIAADMETCLAAAYFLLNT